MKRRRRRAKMKGGGGNDDDDDEEEEEEDATVAMMQCLWRLVGSVARRTVCLADGPAAATAAADPLNRGQFIRAVREGFLPDASKG